MGYCVPMHRRESIFKPKYVKVRETISSSRRSYKSAITCVSTSDLYVTLPMQPGRKLKEQLNTQALFADVIDYLVHVHFDDTRHDIRSR